MKDKKINDRRLKLICPENNNLGHESGEWELKENHLVYKVFIKQCKYCGVVTNENVIRK